MAGTHSEPSSESSPVTDDNLLKSLGTRPNADTFDTMDTDVYTGATASDQRIHPVDDATEQTHPLPQQPSQNGNVCGTKLLYEGPPKCECCINWVEQYPDDLRESAEEKEDTKEKAVVARMKKNHEEGKPLVLDSIVVQNEDLKAFLVDLFQGYRGITPKLKKLVLKAPFHPFFYRWDQFEDLRSRTYEKHSTTRPYATLLYELLRPEIQPLIDEVADLVVNQVITFKLLWALFEPSQRLYENHHSQDRMYVHQSSAYIEDQCGVFFVVTAKFVDWDGNKFGYRTTKVRMPQFAGTKPIRDLDIYPFHLHPSAAQITKTLLTEARSSENCAQYSTSHTRDQRWYWMRGRNAAILSIWQLSERVILDTSLYWKMSEDRPGSLKPLEKRSLAPKLDLEDQDHEDAMMLYENTVQRGMIDQESEDTWQIYPSAGGLGPINLAIPPLEEEELILCNNMLAAYALVLKKWVFLTDINGLQPINWNTRIFPNLVLPKTHKELVLSFIEAHISGDVQFDDIVEGKGLGLLMLLVGDPGLGKTLTAEAVAEKVQKPLYLLSAGELGRDAETVEWRLKMVLEMTAKWNAVLLLDECDVFLQDRSSARLDHNSIVAVSLRLVEYHKGILILTTNRAEAIDSAFQSRIHLTLRYPGLSAEAKATIWRQFVQGTKWAPGNTLTDEQYQELAALRVNGREIKNIVKTAFLLASRDKSPLGLEHLKKVVDATMG
ncbi:P-loop containing nucleoside triphosphate hydrolase protein [Apiospora rasikravindrae]|uniref:P-loop containing nucleoside triphosphate hydrolase protein n=1 Tax=Apiospora rasikravindrae TaxID=990691 RepID=A0ABR1S2V1_9PEZI